MKVVTHGFNEVSPGLISQILGKNQDTHILNITPVRSSHLRVTNNTSQGGSVESWYPLASSV